MYSFITLAVAGFSLEYSLLNVSGYLFYSIYSTGGSVFPYLGTGTVALSDLLFTWHGFALSSLSLSLTLIYDWGI